MLRSEVKFTRWSAIAVHEITALRIVKYPEAYATVNVMRVALGFG